MSRTRNRTKTTGEVFTPQSLVNEMITIEVHSSLFSDPSKTFLDPACGNGQFLVEVMQMRIMNGSSHKDAISTIYGVDIDALNVKECRERLLIGKTDKRLIKIIEHNIILADALDPNHIGWDEVGYMWNGKKRFF